VGSQLALTGMQVFDVGDELGRVYTPDALAAAIVAVVEVDYRPGMMLVECAVGGGAFIRQGYERWPDIHTVGVDIDPRARGFEYVDEALHGDWIEVAEEWAGRIGRNIHHLYATRPDVIISNPDFGRKNCRIPLAHAKACLSLDPEVCALILPHAYSNNATWAPFLAEHRPKYLHRVIGRVWDVVREVDVYEWHRGFRGDTISRPLPGWPIAGAMPPSEEE
jgi:hypothetical protein